MTFGKHFVFFFMTKILTFVDEIFHWEKPLMMKYLFHQGQLIVRKYDFHLDTFSERFSVTNMKQNIFH